MLVGQYGTCVIFLGNENAYLLYWDSLAGGNAFSKLKIQTIKFCAQTFMANYSKF